MILLRRKKNSFEACSCPSSRDSNSMRPLICDLNEQPQKETGMRNNMQIKRQHVYSSSLITRWIRSNAFVACAKLLFFTEKASRTVSCHMLFQRSSFTSSIHSFIYIYMSSLELFSVIIVLEL